MKSKKEALDDMQRRIDALPFTPLIPYPYCCLCFDRLTPENIYEDGEGQLWDNCLNCKVK
jgi:hypothetical protein